MFSFTRVETTRPVYAAILATEDICRAEETTVRSCDKIANLERRVYASYFQTRVGLGRQQRSET
jgi:hypothetical protein